MKEAFISLFMERLRIVDDLKRFPEIRDIQIPAPIFIVGLPRTGSTLLHSCMLPIYTFSLFPYLLLVVLAQDPNLRAPLLWEMEHPSLSRSIPDPRLEKVDQRVSWATAKMPHILSKAKAETNRKQREEKRSELSYAL